MNLTERQTPIDISGTMFPKFKNKDGFLSEKFWYVKSEFEKHSQNLLNEGGIFTSISARLVGDRWICDNNSVSESEVVSFIREMRLFYMKSECMSIYSFCIYMEMHIENKKVCDFFKHMRESWEEVLNRKVHLFGNEYSGSIKTNKQLIDAVLYSGNFHSQEKHKKRYDELLRYMDESLIIMSAYNAMHSGYQMNQISRSINELNKDNLVILLPDHLRHEWDESCPYEVIR